MELDEAGYLLKHIKKSGLVKVGNQVRQIALFSDYINHCIETKGLADQQELRKFPALAEEIYVDWLRKPQVACVFARFMAKDNEQFGIRREVVSACPSEIGEEAYAELITDRTTESIMSPKVEGLSLLLPSITESEQLGSLVRQLFSRAEWSGSAKLNPSDRQERVYIQLKRKLDDETAAEVLGLGPFSFLPLTRQSPVTALEIRTKPDGASGGKGPFSTRLSHLADILIPKIADKKFREFWIATSDQRLAVLGGDDSAAKAKVTFAIPSAFWNT